MKPFVLLVLIVICSNVVVTESQSTSKTTARNLVTIKAGTTVKPVTVKVTNSTTTPKTTTKTTTTTTPKTTKTTKTTTKTTTKITTKITTKPTTKTTTKTTTTTTKPTTKTTTTTKPTTKTTTTTTTKPTTTKSTTKPTTAKLTTSKQITTTVKPKTGPYLLCQETSSTAANGTLQPANLSRNTTVFLECHFDINVNSNYQIQIKCPFINITNFASDTYVRMAGIIEGQQTSYMGYSRIIQNRLYYSINNSVSLSVRFGYPEWLNCQWTSAPKDNTTNYKLCRHEETTAANGTIQTTPLSDTGPARRCSFSIKPYAGQQILFSCSVVQLSNYGTGTFFIRGIINDEYYPPVTLNRIYYSYSDTTNIVIESNLDASDSITCKWTTQPKDITTAYQMCRHGETTAANGTIQQFVGMVKGETPRFCSFFIKGSPNQQIQISCTVINLTNEYFLIDGVVENLSFPNLPVINRIYYSYNNTDVRVTSQSAYSDSLNCKFNVTPLLNNTTNNFKFCRDSEATGVYSGSIQSLAGIAMSEPSRDCNFYVYGPPDKFVNITCSVVELSFGSFFQISGYDGVIADPPIANQVYSTVAGNLTQNIYLYTSLGYGDSIDCKWTFF